MSGYSRQYSRWLAGLSPGQEESYQRTAWPPAMARHGLAWPGHGLARQGAVAQSQVGSQV